MKAATLTTVLAMLVAVPILLLHRDPKTQPVQNEEGKRDNESLRYDIDDFLS